MQRRAGSGRAPGGAGRGDPSLDDVEMFKRVVVRVAHEALMAMWRQAVTAMGITTLDDESGGPQWRDGAPEAAVYHTAFLRASDELSKGGVSHERMQSLMLDVRQRVEKLRCASSEDIHRLFIEPMTTMQRPIVDKYKMFIEAEARRRNRKGIVRGANFFEYIKSLLAHLSMAPELLNCSYFVATPDRLDHADILARTVIETAQNSIVILSSADRFGEKAARRAGVHISRSQRSRRSCSRDVYLDLATLSDSLPSPAPDLALEWGGNQASSTRGPVSGGGGGGGSGSSVGSVPRRMRGDSGSHLLRRTGSGYSLTSRAGSRSSSSSSGSSSSFALVRAYPADRERRDPVVAAVGPDRPKTYIVDDSAPAAPAQPPVPPSEHGTPKPAP